MWSILASIMVVESGCRTSPDGSQTPSKGGAASTGDLPRSGENDRGENHSTYNNQDDPMSELRAAMVMDQIVARGVSDQRVLSALRKVPRHEFVPHSERAKAYQDRPLSIGRGQTISQPYIVAAMTELAEIDENSRVLEIGTGSGYQAAVLAEIAKQVYSIEIVESLGQHAAKVLGRLGYQNIELRIGDGYKGWPEEAPFDAVLVTAAPPAIPQPLIDQLAEGGNMVIPVGEVFQELRVLTKKDGKVVEKTVFGVRFVPMTGEAQKKR